MSRSVLFLLCCHTLFVACATVESAPGTPAVSEHDLLSGTVFFGTEQRPPLPEVDILAVDEAMQAFIDQHVQASRNAYLQLTQLLYAMIDGGIFGLHYDDETHTAVETFHARAGNCLSFTNMFVAMARQVGLEVSYQQVEIPPDWSQRGDTFVLSRHINVFIDLGGAGDHTVDFNIDDMKSNYKMTPVSDARAEAHYYNNVGVSKLQQHDARGAFLYFRRGLESDVGFAPLWTNLGTLYLRHGDLAYAEASYQHALTLDRRDMLAMSNLARLYERSGDAEQAQSYRQRVNAYRLRNPYYRYHLAKQAFRRGDYPEAVKQLDEALRRKPKEHSFHFLMGLSLLQEGKTRGARRHLEKAEELTSQDSLKQNYRNKIDTLLSGQS